MFGVSEELKKICFSSNDTWNNQVNDKKDNVRIDQRKSERGLMMMRAQGPIDYPAKDIVRAL